jgi:hypothetical protein
MLAFGQAVGQHADRGMHHLQAVAAAADSGLDDARHACSATDCAMPQP